MPMDEKLKCRFCGYATLRWSTTRSGKRKPGIVRLLRHVGYAHPKEAEEILKFSCNGEERSFADTQFGCDT